MYKAFYAFGLLLVVGAWLGCAEKEMAPVKGKVLYNGQPLKFGSVMFQSEFGHPAHSVIAADGTFDLWTETPGDGARIGKNEVRITCYEGQNPEAPKGENDNSLGRSLIPVRYTDFANSGFTFTIEPQGHQDVVFELRDE